jgi:hypothetical protein
MPLFMPWDFSGTWVGEYAYDPDPTVPDRPAATGFRLSVQPRWFGRFGGRIEDEPAAGAPGTADVRGAVSLTGVRFTKRYDVLLFRTAAGLVSARAYLASEGYTPLGEVSGSPLRYVGELDPAREVLAGTWVSPKHVRRVWTMNGIIKLPFPEYSGTWFAKRQPA